MAYCIDGESYKAIAGRKFSASGLVDTGNRERERLPFVHHAIRHTYCQNFGIVHFKADFKTDLKISNVTDEGHISLHFQLQGSSEARFSSIRGQHPLRTGEFNVYGADTFRSDLYFDRQEGFEYLAITMKKEYYRSLLSQYGIIDVERIVEREPSFALFKKAVRMDAEIGQALYRLQHLPVPAPLSELYLSAKVSEIVALQLALYGSPNRYRPQVREGLMTEITAFIDAHFLEISSSADLTTRFPVTEAQLQAFLKHRFHTGLFGLLHRKRLEYGAQLLRHSGMNVNEVAWKLGYSSAANFIYAFKKVFHTTPKKFQSGSQSGC